VIDPRNRRAFEEGREVRAAVRAIMAARSPLRRRLTAKAVNAQLPPHLRRDDSVICWHMRAIYDEAEAECADGDGTSLPPGCIA
jgi:hypothetical protein